VAAGAPLRFGVIGAGWFAARRHIPDICAHPDAVLAAICRRNATELAVLSEHFKPKAKYTDWREMIERCSLDAVLIATPHNLHFEPAWAALERGLHVLLEKPMTVDPAEARELCRLADEQKVHLSVALNPPFWAHCHRIRGAIRDGRIGTVESISMYWTGSAAHLFGEAPMPADLPGLVKPTIFRGDPELCGGGYFIDGGSHLVSEILWVTGLKPVRVSCIMDKTPSDRRTALVIELENGGLATIASLGDSDFTGRRVRNTIGGSNGTITIEGFKFRTIIESDGGPESFDEADLPAVPGPVANLIDAIRGRADLESPGSHGAAVVEVIHSAYESAATGKTMRIP